MAKEKKSPIRPGDLILILLLFAAAGGWLVYNHISPHPGLTAQVSVNGRIVAALPLDQDGEFPIENEEGGFNLLTIKDGTIWCSEASCPDHLCMKQGKKSLSNETIVCLPNRMAVTILEGNASPSIP